LSAVFKDKEFIIFLGIFLLNSIATSLPAANLNFYVRDVLEAEESLGYFLSTYFLSAGLSIIFWKNFAQKNGLIKTWITSISGSILTFYFAYYLGAGDGNYFYLICLFSGFFLGGDLIIPPALLAKITKNKDEIISSYFSLWNMTTKIGLMVAASASLIALGNLGYQPSMPSKESLSAIPLFYAAIPCLIKIFTAFFLIKLLRSKKLPSYEN
jgi:GPH family glycoside/pentoside/hexuronide:cation symporter